MRGRVRLFVEWYRGLGEWQKSGVLFGGLVCFVLVVLLVYSVVAVFMIPQDVVYQRPVQSSTVDGLGYYTGYELDLSRDVVVRTKILRSSDGSLNESAFEQASYGFVLKYDVSERAVLMRVERVGGVLTQYAELDESTGLVDVHSKWASGYDNWKEGVRPMSWESPPYVTRQVSMCSSSDGSTGFATVRTPASLKEMVYGEMVYRAVIPPNEFRSTVFGDGYTASDTVSWTSGYDELNYVLADGHIRFKDSYVKSVSVSEKSMYFDAVEVESVPVISDVTATTYETKMNMTVSYEKTSVEAPVWVNDSCLAVKE